MRGSSEKMVGTAFQRIRPPKPRLHLTPMHFLKRTLAALDRVGR